MDRARRILVVDDDPLVLFTLRGILEMTGQYEIVTAASAQEALAALDREGDFGVVVTDLVLGNASGVDLTEEIARRHGDTPVIWMTAYGCHRVRADMRRLCPMDCLEKPLEIQEIRQAVAQALTKWSHDDHAQGGQGHGVRDDQR